MRKSILSLSVLVFVLGISCVNIGTDEVGVKTVYINPIGEKGVSKTTYGTGYQVYVPPFTGFSILKKTEQKLEMTKTLEKGSKSERDDLKFKTSDGNNIWVDVTVSWKIIEDKAWAVVENAGVTTGDIEDHIIRPTIRSQLRYYMGTLTSEEFYNATARDKAVNLAKDALVEELSQIGLTVTGILLNDYHYEDDYQKAIEDRKLYNQRTEEYTSLSKAASEDVKRKVFDAKAQSNAMIEKAKGELEKSKIKGDALLYEAQQQAEAIFALKKAEAEGLTVLNEALQGEGGRHIVAKALAEALKNKTIRTVPMSDSGSVSIVDVNSFLDNLVAQKVLDKTKAQKAESTEKTSESSENPTSSKEKKEKKENK